MENRIFAPLIKNQKLNKMSVLERLRKRSGFLVAAVGVALLAFVLTGLFESKGSMFRAKQTVGEIAGQDISYEDFNRLIEQKEFETVSMMEDGQSIDPQTKDRLNQEVWDKLVNDLTLGKEMDDAGITVTDDELSNMFIGDEIDPMIKASLTDQQGKPYPAFVDERTGEISGAKIKAYVDQLTDNTGKDKEAQDKQAKFYRRWKKFEQDVRDNRRLTKYKNLIKKGLYCTKSFGEAAYHDNNTSVQFRYVLKRYQSVPDSSVKVSEEEIAKYYNENQKKYKQEASRKIEYLVWDILPSADDEKTAMDDMKTLGETFKKETDDSTLVTRESEAKGFQRTFISKKQMPANIDSSFFNAEKGSVYGPFKDGDKIKIVKLVNTKMSLDSGGARHILITYAGAQMASPAVTRTQAQAKSLADSLLKILKTKGTSSFPDMVLKYSSDSGSVREMDKKDPKKKNLKKRDELGAYKWFKEGAMTPAFQDFVWEGKKGDLKVVETPFGYHIMEVINKSKESRRIELQTIEKSVEPSTKTKQDIFDKASDFAAKYKTPELFNKGVETEKLNKRIADPVTESQKSIVGLDGSKEMIRWSFTNPQGTITADPFNFGDKYVIAMITEVREKGIAPLEQKRNEVEIGAKQEKKAQMFMDDMNKALTGASTIDALSTKVNLPVVPVENLSFSTFNIPNLGQEPSVSGTLFTLPLSKLSKPIKGKTGVFVVVVDKNIPAPPTKDYLPTQKQVIQNLQLRVDQDLYKAMQTKADIQDDRGKIY